MVSHILVELASYQHLTISNRCCEVMWFLLWENNILLLLVLLSPTNHDFGKCKQHLLDILFFISNYFTLVIDFNITCKVLESFLFILILFI